MTNKYSVIKKTCIQFTIAKGNLNYFEQRVWSPTGRKSVVMTRLCIEKRKLSKSY